MTQYRKLSLYVYLSIIFHISGIHSQISHVIDTIRLPWDKPISSTTEKPYNPFGDTIDIVDSSMVHTLPDNVGDNKIGTLVDPNGKTLNENRDVVPINSSVATVNDHNKIVFSSQPGGTTANKNNRPSVLAENGNRIDLLQNFEGSKEQNTNGPDRKNIQPESRTKNRIINREPVVSAGDIDTTSVLHEQNSDIQRLINDVPSNKNFSPNFNGNFGNSQHFKADSIIHEEGNELKPILNVQQMMLPSNFRKKLTGTPLKYKTNYSSSHSFGHSSNFNMSWENDTFVLQSSNESFEKGNQAHNHLVKTEKDVIRFSNETQHSGDKKAATKLLRNHNFTRLSTDKNAVTLNSNKHLVSVLSNGSNSTASHNKTKRVVESDTLVNELANTPESLKVTSNMLLKAMKPHQTREEFRTDMITKKTGHQLEQELVLQQNKSKIGTPKRKMFNGKLDILSSSSFGQNEGTVQSQTGSLGKINTIVENNRHMELRPSLKSMTKINGQENSNLLNSKWKSQKDIRNSKPSLRMHSKSVPEQPAQNYFKSSWHSSWWSTS